MIKVVVTELTGFIVHTNCGSCSGGFQVVVQDLNILGEGGGGGEGGPSFSYSSSKCNLNSCVMSQR